MNCKKKTNFAVIMLFISENFENYFKGTMLKNLVNNCELDVEAVYGSARDVSIYQSLRLDPAKIFIISKPSRRLASKCKVSNPYHKSRPA